MKRIALTLLAAGALFTAKAQLFNPDSLNGALFGGIIGGIIGNNVHHQTWEGVAIGAGSGYVLGNVVNALRGKSDGSSKAGNKSRGSYHAWQPVYVVPVSSAANTAPRVPESPAAYKYESPMSDANGLFGR